MYIVSILGTLYHYFTSRTCGGIG